MKILYYIHTLGIGGAETIVVNDLIALQERGHEVALVVNDEKDSFLAKRLAERNIRVIALRPIIEQSIISKVKHGIWRFTGYYRKRWNKIFEKEAPDILHVHTATNFLRKIDFPPERMIYTFHGEVLRYINLHGKRNFENIKKLANKGMTFFSLRAEMTEDIKKYFKTDRIEYIPNGMDISGIRQKRYDRNTFLREYGLAADTFLVGHVGRFHPVKNQMRSVEIFDTLSEKHSNACLVFVGDGHEDYLQNVRKRVNELKLEDKVLFLGLRNDAVQIMSVFDTLILPSTTECFPLVLVEAQALGIRTVASNVVPEEMLCNVNCFRLGLRESNEKWADYISGDFIGEKSKDIEIFSIDKVVDKMVQCYEKLLHD